MFLRDIVKQLQVCTNLCHILISECLIPTNSTRLWQDPLVKSQITCGCYLTGNAYIVTLTNTDCTGELKSLIFNMVFDEM